MGGGNDSSNVTHTSLCELQFHFHTYELWPQRDSLERYYDLLEETLRSNEIFDDFTCIFNCDETGLPLNPKPVKVVWLEIKTHAMLQATSGVR